MRKIAFEKTAFEDFSEWATADKQIHRRIVALISDILREPFSGLGKPEPLRHPTEGPPAAGRPGRLLREAQAVCYAAAGRNFFRRRLQAANSSRKRPSEQTMAGPLGKSSW